MCRRTACSQVDVGVLKCWASECNCLSAHPTYVPDLPEFQSAPYGLQRVTPSTNLSAPPSPFSAIVRYAASRFLGKAAVSDDELVALLQTSRCLIESDSSP